MKNKITWTIVGVFIIVLISLFLTKSVNEDSWICTDKGWMPHGNPSSLKPTTLCSKIEKEQIVEKYLNENISTISPIKEVLGGKFYITKLIWAGDNSGVIEYEDGHIVLAATFDYEIKTGNSSIGNEVIIENFKIVQQ